jgi:hypothetical protein
MTDSTILSSPLCPGWLKKCPSCCRRFALKLDRTLHDRNVGRVVVYRCKYCEKFFEFAERIPPRAL